MTDKKYPTITISSLRFAEYNPRKVSRSVIEQLKRSLSEFGCPVPIVINTHKSRKNVVVGGEKRVRAATELGWTEVPYSTVSLPLEKEKALNLALNKIEDQWDEEKLAQVITELTQSDFDVSITGFNEVEVSNLLDTTMLLDAEDEKPWDTEEELKKISDPISKYGEVYQIGPHRLMCGDSTNPEDVKKLMGDKVADMVFTDPPYNVAHTSKEKRGKFHTEEGTILGDDQSQEEFRAFTEAFFKGLYGALKPGGTIYICTGYSSYPLFYYQMLNTGFVFSSAIVWVKPSFSIGWGDYKKQYEQVMKGKKGKGKTKAEAIIYGWKQGEKHRFAGELNESDVWTMPRKAVTEMVHPTEKPEWLIMKAIKGGSRRGQIVLDLFGGSGSTLMAAHKLGRVGYAMERDERFCDLIRKRTKRLKFKDYGNQKKT
jgi:DNA modification methylase